MDSSFLFAKLKELGPVNSEKDNLIEHCTQNIQQIIKFLSRRLLASDGGQILDYLFNGLTESLKIHKIKIVDVILQTMRKEPSSLTHCADIISRLCLELPQLPANDLVRWCNDSIQSVVEDTDVNMIWRDIVPECISSLQNYDSIQHYDTEMSSDDYKTQCVHTLCQFQWKEEHLVQLAAMFTDMQLSRVDHTQVVNKMCSLIIKVAPENLPPLTLQLMRFLHHSRIQSMSVKLYISYIARACRPGARAKTSKNVAQNSAVEVPFHGEFSFGYVRQGNRL